MSLADKLKQQTKISWTKRPQVLACAPLPLPMHGLAPRVVLGNQWWDAVRYAAYRSTNYHCIVCGETGEQLEGHEVYDTDWLLGRMTYVETVPLCSACHSFIHQGYLNIQLHEGIITQAQYDYITERGYNLLRAVGLQKRESGITHVEWSEWRLVIGNKEYPPLYPNYQAYLEHYETK